MKGSEERIWLNGETFDTAYLFDVRSGTIERRLRLGRAVGTTAGLGCKCGRSFLAIYVDSNGLDLYVQVDEARFLIDGDTRAVHRPSWLGLRSNLRISKVNQPALQFSCFLGFGGLVQSLVDPGYDGLDRSLNDLPADIADIIESRARHNVLREVKDAQAGPWDAVSG